MNILKSQLPPLTSLIAFESTARLGSITLAASELSLTQAAVSKQIKSLEENLNTSLFDRRNRGLFLTDAGQDLLDTTAIALGNIAQTSSRLRNPYKPGEIVFFAQLCEGLYWVMPRLSRFYQEHPDIEIKVSVSTRPLTEATEYFDLALQTSVRKSGQCKKLFSVPDSVFPVCSPKYQSRIKSKNLKEITSLHVLHHKADPQDWIEWNEWLEEFGITVDVSRRGSHYDSYPMMMQAALEGHGLALAWEQTSRDFLRDGALVRPFDEYLCLEEGLTVYTHPAYKPRKEVDIFKTWLKSALLSDD